MKLFIYSYFILICFCVHGQKQNNQWYFGDSAAIDFNSGIPTSINGNIISTDEGCASIADVNGNLLFYTNGEIVIDRTHSIMPNGSGLAGSYSSTQSAIIIPVPTKDSLYYIFTVPAQLARWGGIYSGLSYSVVDMRLNNGRGDVSRKNVLLIDSVVEKLTAIRHKNKRDVWVVVHRDNSSDFYAYLISCDTVHEPVVSSSGSRYYNGGSSNAHGCMKISPQGNKLATTWTEPDHVNSQSIGHLEIFDFDNATGVVSNPLLITDTGFVGYSVCFSPAGSRLYWGGYFQGGWITQYDMLSHDIPNSGVVLNTNWRSSGTMQLAPDGAIYVALLNGAHYLSRIDYPDSLGHQSNFTDTAVHLGSARSTWGLPNNWDNFDPTPQLSISGYNDTAGCAPISLAPAIASVDSIQSLLWSTGESGQAISVSESGNYWLMVQDNCSSITDTISVIAHSVTEQFEDTVLCADQELTITSNNSFFHYYWSDGSTGPTFILNQAGKYWVEIIDTNGCTKSDTINVFSKDCSCAHAIPNIFTPNGDGKNDYFNIGLSCAPEQFELSVYNRWGQRVFMTHDYLEHWNGRINGRDAAAGVYYYIVNYFMGGTNATGHVRRKGHVELIK